MCRYKAILFDLDGTLIDSYEPIAESLNMARNHFGKPALTVGRVRRIVGHGLESLIADDLGENNVERGVRIFREHYERVFLEKTVLLPNVRETLSKLKKSGIKMAVTSNKPSCFGRKILENLGLLPFMDAVLGPFDVENPKPAPDMIYRALDIMGVYKSDALYVGDMSVDIETCRNAGVVCWVIPTGSQTEEELRESGPDRMIRRFDELTSIMEN